MLVAVYGDSWTDPRNTGPGAWPDQLAAKVGAQVVNHAAGGSGYTRVGTASTFPHALTVTPEPTARVAVVFGGVNDVRDANPTGVQCAATVAHTVARQLMPATALLVVGPQWVDTAPSDALRACSGAVAAAAQATGTTFVDPLGWLTGRPDLIGPDGAHPNAAGQTLVAEKMAALVDQLLRPVLTGAPRPAPWPDGARGELGSATRGDKAGPARPGDGWVSVDRLAVTVSLPTARRLVVTFQGQVTADADGATAGVAIANPATGRSTAITRKVPTRGYGEGVTVLHRETVPAGSFTYVLQAAAFSNSGVSITQDAPTLTVYDAGPA